MDVPGREADSFAAFGMTTKNREHRRLADLEGLAGFGRGGGGGVGLVAAAAEGGQAADGKRDSGPDEEEGTEGGEEGDGLAGGAEELAGVEEADDGAPAAAAGGGGEGLPLEDAGVSGGEGELVAEDGLAVAAGELEGEGLGVAGGQAERDAADAGGEGESAGKGCVELSKDRAGRPAVGRRIVPVLVMRRAHLVGGARWWAFAAGWRRGLAGGAEEQSVGPGVGHDDAGGGDSEQGQTEPEAGDVVEVAFAGAAAEAGAGDEGVTQGRRGGFAREPEIEAAEDEDEEDEGGGVLEGAEGLVANAGEGGLMVELADGAEGDAEAVGAGAEDLTGAAVGEENGAVWILSRAGRDLGGLVGVGEDGEGGEGSGGGGCGVGEEGRGRDAGSGGGVIGADLTLGEGDELGLEGDDAAGEGEKGDEQADDEADREVEPEEEAAEDHEQAFRMVWVLRGEYIGQS